MAKDALADRNKQSEAILPRRSTAVQRQELVAAG